MQLAPIIIPTLNRIEHFQRCIESLEMCSLANQTDVFVGLDFPPSEKYVEGWKKIDSYLNQKERSHGFKKLVVYRRVENCGIGTPTSNIRRLIASVKELSYENFILTEDDNVFSPCFLEYINKGLEKFKDDERILAINGYRHYYDVNVENSSFFVQNVDFSAWGYGIWFSKYDALIACLNRKFFRKNLTLSSIHRLLQNGRNRMKQFMDLAITKKEIVYSDTNYSVVMAINNWYVVMPAESCVRNLGWDKSGTHILDNDVVAKKHMEQTISDKKHFEFIGDGWDQLEINRKVYRDGSYGNISRNALLLSCFKSVIKHIIGR